MRNRDIKRIENLLFYATKSENPITRVAAAIFHKRKILTRATNLWAKSHPTQKKLNSYRFLENENICNHSLHAEVNVLLSIGNNTNFSEYVLYVARISKRGKPLPARPCKGCMEYIKQKGIKKIIYTTDSGIAVEEITY